MNTHKKLLYSACAYALFIGSLNFAATTELTSTPQAQQATYVANDLIIILDPEAQESNQFPEAMTSTLMMALQQQAAPIIVTKNLIENFCSLREIIGTENLAKMRQTIKSANPNYINTIMQKAETIHKKLYADLSPETEPFKIKHPTDSPTDTDELDSSEIPIISVIDLNNKNWHGYIHNNENLVLLIPQTYISKNKQGDIKACGFALESLTKIPDLSPEALMPFLESYKTKTEVTDEFMNALESMFIHNQSTPWNIYLAGHGSTEKVSKTELLKNIEWWHKEAARLTEYITQTEQNIKTTQQEIEKLQATLTTLHANTAKKQQKTIEKWQKMVEESQKKIDELQKDPQTTPEQLEQAQDHLEMDTTTLKHAQEQLVFNETLELEKLQKKVEAWQNNLNDTPDIAEDIEQFLQSALEVQQTSETLSEGLIWPGMLAGLNFTHFTRLMKFFETHIKTSYLHYSTCFGGGVNQAFLNDELKKLSVNFIVVSEGIAETSTMSFNIDPYFADNTWIFSSLRFNVFFNLLNEFFGNARQTKTFTQVKLNANEQATQEITAWKNDPLKAIIRSVVPENEDAANTPFIRFPAVGTFSAMGIDRKIKILTNSIVRAYELEGEPIDLSGTLFENIIVYPPRIGVTLNLGGVSPETSLHKSIVVPTPTTFSPFYQATTIFEKITCEQSLDSFCFNLVVDNASRFKKTFLVKELNCWNYETSGLGFRHFQDIVITDMIALLSPDEATAQIVAGNLEVCFKCNGQIYYGTIHIPDFEDDTILFDLFTSLTFAPASAQQIKSLAEKIVPGTIMKSTEPTALLTELASTIDSSVETIVPQPGALKKVLEKKKVAPAK